MSAIQISCQLKSVEKIYWCQWGCICTKYFFLPKQVIFLNQQVSSSFMLPQITKQVMSELNEINICYYFNEKCYVSIRIWSNIILRRNENINLTSLPLPLYLQLSLTLPVTHEIISHLKLSGRYSHHKLSIRMLWWLTFHIAQVSWFYIAQWESHLNILRNEFGGANLLFSVDFVSRLRKLLNFNECE